MLRTLSFIANHPLTRDRPIAGFTRFANWQIRSRLNKELEVLWLEGAKLIVRRGMTGATGNIYCGLHEFSDMAFLLHLLRPEDLFVDIGANIGSYTVLASAVVGSSTIAAEPDPQTMAFLDRNIEVNGISKRVTTVEAAIGREPGRVRFTVGLDTINHIAANDDANTRSVAVRTLDSIIQDRNPALIKIDVEGFEEDVLAGASETLSKPSLLAVETEGTTQGVVDRLVEAGFVRQYYEPFSRRLSSTAMGAHSNALFIRQRGKVECRLQAAPRRQILGKQF